MIGKILKNELSTYEACTGDPLEFLRQNAARARAYLNEKEKERLHRSNWHAFWFCVVCVCGIILMALIQGVI